MGHAGTGSGKEINLLPVEFHAMGVPDVLAGPAQILGVLTGTAAELRLAIGDILVILRQMSVQHHPLVAGQDRRVAHQLAADRERRTGREANPAHGAFVRIVKGIHHTDHVVEDVRFALHQAVGRQAAVAFADAHGAAGGVKAQPHLGGGMDGVVQPPTVGKEVEVIRGQTAARECQLCQPQLGGDLQMRRSHARPDRVERLEPTEQQRILPARHRARQVLVEVVVSVDEPRRDHRIAGLNDRFITLKPGADLGNHPVPDPDVDGFQHPPRIIHGEQGFNVLDQKSRHDFTLHLSPVSVCGGDDAPTEQGQRTRRAPIGTTAAAMGQVRQPA